MRNNKIHKMTRIAILSAISAMLMYFDFPLWFAPAFYKIDLSELPVLIGAFALGPVAGIITEAIKIVLVVLVKGSTTGGVGEIANFVIGVSFVLPAAFIYKHYKTKKAAVVGMITGTLVLAAVGGLFNAFVLIPLYSRFMPLEQILAVSHELNPNIDSIRTLVLFAVIPFNLVKGTAVSIVTALIYKNISHILKK